MDTARPRKASGVIFGLVAAAVFVGLWTWRNRDLADHSSAPAVFPKPPAPKTAETGATPPSAVIQVPRETTPRNNVTAEISPSLTAEIVEALATGDAAARLRVLNELFPTLLASDRAAAVRLLDHLPPSEQRVLLVCRLARNWGAADFAGAVAWISKLTDASERKAAFDEACLAAAELDPAEAIRAWEIAGFKEDSHVLENLVQNWARFEPAAAESWVLAQPPSAQRDQAIARVAYVLARVKPVDAASLVIRELPEGPVQTEAVISILHQWIQSDPAGASAWVAHFPDGPLADRAKGEIAGQRWR
jgi:hypothetical protein